MRETHLENLEMFGSDDTLLNPQVFTHWSIVHALAGGALRELGFSTKTAFGIHLAYEAKDVWVTYFREKPPELSQQNSWPNSVADQASAWFGHVHLPVLKPYTYLVATLATAFFFTWANDRNSQFE